MHFIRHKCGLHEHTILGVAVGFSAGVDCKLLSSFRSTNATDVVQNIIIY